MKKREGREGRRENVMCYINIREREIYREKGRCKYWRGKDENLKRVSIHLKHNIGIQRRTTGEMEVLIRKRRKDTGRRESS